MRSGRYQGLSAAPIAPVPEEGCCGRLQWRLELPANSDFETLTRRLVGRGYEGRCLEPFLKVLRRPEGHEIVLVPTTGRVQLRVYHLTPEDQRQAVVSHLWGDLAGSL